jgi:hypothetical protein
MKEHKDDITRKDEDKPEKEKPKQKYKELVSNIITNITHIYIVYSQKKIKNTNKTLIQW